MKHIEKMEEWYCSMFGLKSKLTFMLPLEKGDRPELDASKYLDQDGIQKLGAIQWDSSFGR